MGTEARSRYGPGPGLGIRGTQKKSGLKVEFYKSLEPGKATEKTDQRVQLGGFGEKFKTCKP